MDRKGICSMTAIIDYDCYYDGKTTENKALHSM
jgi:hypothetical protein